MAKIGTNANCIICWPNLEPILVASPDGQILNKYKWNHLQLAKFGTNASDILCSWRDNSSYRLYILGPLCLWQCLGYIHLHVWGPKSFSVKHDSLFAALQLVLSVQRVLSVSVSDTITPLKSSPSAPLRPGKEKCIRIQIEILEFLWMWMCGWNHTNLDLFQLNFWYEINCERGVPNKVVLSKLI